VARGVFHTHIMRFLEGNVFIQCDLAHFVEWDMQGNAMGSISGVTATRALACLFVCLFVFVRLLTSGAMLLPGPLAFVFVCVCWCVR
jgi:hypothetical protein